METTTVNFSVVEDDPEHLKRPWHLRLLELALPFAFSLSRCFILLNPAAPVCLLVLMIDLKLRRATFSHSSPGHRLLLLKPPPPSAGAHAVV
ncbi:hypothetical protein E2562_000772 [Oryza meyeriana var. granulata]|uniref:Uncharacterized protein n=1 Tax=Oryza meyeriana var. granulata TaxID=110450 RepID=A0A6G1DUM5_9ORYZ|nr:hypothetical protein E2562_000772 [Oryza meyeriana var. granulata]